MKYTVPLLTLLSTLGLAGSAVGQGTPFKAPRPTVASRNKPQAVVITPAVPQLAATSPRQAARLETLPRPVRRGGRISAIQVSRAPETGLPVFIQATGTRRQGVASANPTTASLQFLQELGNEMRVQNPQQEFVVRGEMRDELGQTHVRLQQRWQGIPVYGSEVVVHTDATGQPLLLSGRYFASPGQLRSTTPSLSASSAAGAALAALHTKTRVTGLSEAARKLLDYQGPATELVVYHATPAAAPVLAWHVTSRPSFREQWETFVDAGSGRVLEQYESSCAADGPRTAKAQDLNGVTRTINTYQWGNGFYLLDGAQPMFNLAKSAMPDDPAGALLTLDANNSAPAKLNLTHVANNNNAWSLKAAVSAHYNASVAYNYYRNTHGRNAIDGNGGTILSIVRLAEEDGTGMDNAFWNGKLIAYGEGNVGFKSLSGGLDVAGHEMTHGVVQSTANLEYKGQSGALNESMADVFGAMMDRDDWTIGEDVVLKTAFPSGALRSLQDPHNGGSNLNSRGYQPRTMAELYTGTEDNGGVHINSGIPNWAFYKFATAIGRDHAEKVWYRALNVYLTRSSQFLDLRLGVIQAATDLYGASSAEVTAAKTAFDAVGITNGQPTNTTKDQPTNPGQDFILLYNTDANVQGTLYLSKTDASAFQRLSNTAVLSRPSINDKGTVAVFVDGDHKLRALQLGSTVSESVVQNDPIWHNVAISKDGTKLAAVTTDQDTSIYVFDLAKSKVARFMLYNPTNSSGVKGTGVRYADALEWDFSGQFLVYDSYNVIPNASGTDIDFWDIGFLHVWDNSKKTWGTGQIEKLVQNLPEGLSIGNPVLSKNSPYIMAFDMLDADGGSTPFSIMALNLETGEGSTIYSESGVAGTPCFSKLDDKLLFTAMSSEGNEILAFAPLTSTKVNVSGTPVGLVDKAKWGVWFAQGSRVLANRDEAAMLPGLVAYPNPTHDELTIQTEAAATATLYDLLGRAVRTTAVGPGRRAVVSLQGLAAGTYVLRATDGKRTATRMVVKQ
ncbi:T9SS type A sorting domain-containing protein [Hymenobacter lutimineralis]|uniref:T9SS type A sorting domain-containing protein n=1 Tax=Hymenobacter lutimineralis TaxID=2606448 RepID=A0A5D6V8N6_9BACT|nr:M4 family metallopeptidase [Hymenobacter lutimineralis]TYZ11866.1 T9SS type A sorting domain-containing protein [Hymenobacter lutimineralis]